jgi:hypothetical protein
VPGFATPLDAVSVFASVAADVMPYEGPMPEGLIEEAFVRQLGLPGLAEHVVIAPVRVKGRVVALLYAELPPGAPPTAKDAILAASRHTAETLVRMILLKKGAT